MEGDSAVIWTQDTRQGGGGRGPRSRTLAGDSLLRGAARTLVSPRLGDLNCAFCLHPGPTPGWGRPAGHLLTPAGATTRVGGGGGGDGRGYNAAPGSHPFFSGGRPGPQRETPRWRAGVRSRGARGVAPGTELPRSARARGLAPSRHRRLGAGTRTCLPPRDGARCGDFIAEPRKRELASREARAGWR